MKTQKGGSGILLNKLFVPLGLLGLRKLYTNKHKTNKKHNTLKNKTIKRLRKKIKSKRKKLKSKKKK